MKIRKVTSLTAALTFLVMVLTSIILYIVPQGRVAYWADWRLWGLSKTQWGDLHINAGLLFLVALLLHLYYNWSPIMNYLKNKARKLTVFTREFNLALGLTLVCLLGTYYGVPPFSTILEISQQIKDTAARDYGEPPFGHAEEAPFDSLVKKTGLDLDQSLVRLEAAGIVVERPDQIFLEIARAHGMTPQQIFTLINVQSQTGRGLPEIPPPGSGNLTLQALCETYGKDLTRILSALKQEGLTAGPDQTIKSIAQQNNLTPIQAYDRVRAAADPA